MAIQRKLKRNDVVLRVEDIQNGGWRPYGRVWRRLDEDTVVVIDEGLCVTIGKDDDFVPTDYKGLHKEAGERHNNRLLRKRWFRPMTSLRRLKYNASRYHPYFKGWRGPKHKRKLALEHLLSNKKHWTEIENFDSI